MKQITLILCLLTFFTLPACAESEQGFDGEVSFSVEQVSDGLGVPWGMAFISDTQMLITEREGTVKLLDLDSEKQSAIQGAPAVPD